MENIHLSQKMILLDSCPLTRECIRQVIGLKTRDFIIEDHELLPQEGIKNAKLILINTRSERISDGSKMFAQLNLIQKYDKGMPIILISSVDDPDIIREVFFRFNLRGYVPSSYGTEILIAALRLVMVGGTFVPNSILSMQFPDVGKKLEKIPIIIPDLTSRERDVFSLVREGKPNKIIAFELNISEQTVKVHVKNMMKKFNLTNRTQLAVMHS